MFHVLALAASAYTVQPGDTLSGIAASNGISLSAIEADNPQISDPNLIIAGETVNLGGSGASAPAPSSPSPSSISSVQPQSPAPSDSGSSSGGSSGGGGFHIPGMPDSLANCIAYRESTSGTNPAAGGNVFGIIPASGYSVAGMSVAQQEQVAGQIYATTGGSAWSADGCPGT